MGLAQRSPSRAVGSAAFRTLAEQLDDPSVFIEYRPGVCASEAMEVFGGPKGPRPDEVAVAICRTLDLRACDLTAWPDDQAAPEAVFTSCFLVRHATGAPVARVHGMDDDRLNSGLIAHHLRAAKKADPAAIGGRL